ncbi:hypothetical protein C1A50_1422 [Paenibacillus polymyxa]|nr:hypothetical protein C1A50_1422 [Paenibacillus polymyxa]
MAINLYISVFSPLSLSWGNIKIVSYNIQNDNIALKKGRRP